MPQQGQELLPEVHVEHGLLVALDPVALLPAGQPAFFHGVTDVFGIGVEVHLAGFAQGGEGRDDAAQFHAVVGGQAGAAHQLAAGRAAHQAEDGGPAAPAGIAQAGTVRIDDDFLHDRAV